VVCSIILCSYLAARDGRLVGNFWSAWTCAT
jgi:hypothetical protein